MIRRRKRDPDMLRSVLAATAALVVVSAPAIAAPAQEKPTEKMVWHIQDSEDTAALVYGVPDSDKAAIFFLCQKDGSAITVQSMIGSKDLARGAQTAIVLSAGSVKKSYPGKAVAMEEGDAVNVEAPAQMTDVKALTKASGTLTIEVKGAKQAISLSGIGPAITKFETACKPKS